MKRLVESLSPKCNTSPITNLCLYCSVRDGHSFCLNPEQQVFDCLGEKLTEHLKLRPLQSDYDSSYDKEIDAGISNEFSTAAYRFGHSMLQVFILQDINLALLLGGTLIIRLTKSFMQGLVEIYGAQGRNVDYMQFTKILFNPFALWDFGKLDAVVRGNAQQCPRKLDTSFSTQVSIVTPRR